jgi:hypothetical protein
VLVLEGGTARPWISLDALGRRAAAVEWMTADGDDLLVASSVARDPQGLGWALHRLDPAGKLRASFELTPSPQKAHEVVRRHADLLLTRQRGEVVELDLQLTSAAPIRGPRLDPRSPMSSHGTRSLSADGSSLRVLAGAGPIAVERTLALDLAPEHVALGEGWAAWSRAKKLRVELDDGPTLEPRTGGRVDVLASSGTALAALLGMATHPRLLVVSALGGP